MPDQLGVLTQWAHTLELALVFACVHEAVQQLQLAPVADVGRELARVDALVATLSRLDPTRVLEENAALLAPFASLLEESGFRRTPEGIKLTEEKRQVRLERIREDRLARGGEPASSAEHVARDVIASQRIEGIDARTWIRS